MDQETLRRRILKQRNSVSIDFQRNASSSICQQIINSDDYQQAKNIAAYIAVGREINLQVLIDQACKDSKAIYLPRLNSTAMEFAAFKNADSLVANQFGIPEPCAQQPSIDIAALDIICIPLVAFDDQGNRIGMGGGYYDRSLATVKHQAQPIRIGIAYKEQQIPNCIANPWDVPLHKVITPI